MLDYHFGVKKYNNKKLLQGAIYGVNRRKCISVVWTMNKEVPKMAH